MSVTLHLGAVGIIWPASKPVHLLYLKPLHSRVRSQSSLIECVVPFYEHFVVVTKVLHLWIESTCRYAWEWQPHLLCFSNSMKRCGHIVNILLVYQQIYPQWFPKIIGELPRIPFRETTKLRIRGFFVHERTRVERFIMKCRKALWLRAPEALWSNCKRTQASKWRFYLCKKYELDRVNRMFSNNSNFA